MRVGLFSYDFYPHIGGQGRHVYEIYKRLKNHPEIDLLVFSPSGTSLEKHIQVGKLFKRYGANLTFSLVLNFKINSLIERYNLDLIHLHGGPGGVLLLKKLKTPIVFTSHHTYAQQYSKLRMFYQKILSIAERVSYKNSNSIIAVSTTTKKSLRYDYGINENKITVIPNGVDLARFRVLNTIEKIPNSILYVGRLDRRKGLDFLIDTIPLVAKTVPKIKLFVVGEGKLRNKLEKRAKIYGQAKNLQFMGFLSDNEVVRWYNKVEIVTVPSIFEGFGITVIEAMACGTPVIATRTDGIVDIVVDNGNGLLAEYGDKEMLARKIVTLLQDSLLQQKIKTNARKYVEYKFDWDNIVKKISELYETFTAKNQ